MNQDNIIISRQQKTICDLKTEIIFLKDKIRYHQKKLKETTAELKAEIIYWKETAKYYQDMINDMTIKEIKKDINKTLDN